MSCALFTISVVIWWSACLPLCWDCKGIQSETGFYLAASRSPTVICATTVNVCATTLRRRPAHNDAAEQKHLCRCSLHHMLIVVAHNQSLLLFPFIAVSWGCIDKACCAVRAGVSHGSPTNHCEMIGQKAFTKCFGATTSAIITRQSLYKAKSLECPLATRDTSGSNNAKIIIWWSYVCNTHNYDNNKGRCSKDFFGIVSARMVWE